MDLRGRPLQLVYLSLGHGIDDLRNEVAVCPNPLDYETEIEEIECLIGEMEELQQKVLAHPHFTLPPECMET
jgi:hypothetical protein